MLKKYETLILVFIIFSLSLILRFLFYFSSTDELRVGERVTIEHTFLEIPKKSSFNQYFYIDNVLVSLPSFPEYRYGDKIILSGVIETITSNDEIILTERLVIRNPEVKMIESKPLAVLSFLRQRIISTYKYALPSREAGLISGIVLGAEEGISSSFKEELKRSGMLHVVVASGSNVVLVAGVLLSLLTNLMKKRKAVFFTITGIFLYAMLTGFEPPIVRASIMASFGFAATLFGRQRVALMSLFFSGWLMLMVSPKLISDIGFQLSFSATLGILLFQKAIFALTKIIPRLIKEDFATTLSAQIGALPFLLVSFGEVNLLSIFINVILLWTVPIIMIFGLIAGVLSLVFPIFSLPFLYLSYPFLAFFSKTVELTSNFYIPLTLTSVALPIAIIYYVFGVWILLKIRSTDSSA